MKNLCLSTAVAALLAMPALAANTDSTFIEMASPKAVSASDLIGMRVYTTDTETIAEASAGLQDGWDDIGEINDIVLDRAGNVDALLVDIGGFFGLGERQVAIDMSALNFVADDATEDQPDDFFLVLNMPRTLLEEAPAYQEASVATPSAIDDNAFSTETAKQDMLGSDETTATTDEEIAAAEMTATVDVRTLTAEELTGARVYDTNSEDIGEVSSVVLSTSGKIESVIVDVGGFLGMGEKPVALPVDDLNIQRDAGESLMVSVDHSMETLKAMPEQQS